MKMLSFWGEPLNKHYNPDRENNGGGYWQYLGGALYLTENGVPVEIVTEDSSRGDFGTIHGYTVYVGKLVYQDDWGTNVLMCGHYDPDPAVLKAAAAKVGISEKELVDYILEADKAANMAAKWAWENTH